ncbi:MAG: DUF1330 domain-containing protein [Gammaproteobacteria bacterium]|nr:DUF1330 domain-containing protein [Gammaproteobacteria bacterium]
MAYTRIQLSGFLCLIILVCSSSVYSEANNEKSGAVYLVAQIDIKDYQDYMKKYGRPVTQQLIKAGAEILVATQSGEVLEGEWSGNWTVISKFPNSEAVNSWYNSKEYSLFKKMRVTELINNGNIIVLPGLK